MLLDARVGQPADIERAWEASQGFERFVRSLVGLDRAAVIEAFGEFLSDSTAARGWLPREFGVVIRSVCPAADPTFCPLLTGDNCVKSSEHKAGVSAPWPSANLPSRGRPNVPS